MAARKTSPIVTANLIGILPLQEAVLFPNTVIPLAVVKKPGIQLVEEALREGKPIGLTVHKNKET
jgi:ATP-dependent Lon protease